MKTGADVPGVSRSHLPDRLKGTAKPRRRPHEAQDAALRPGIAALVTARPTCGCRRIAAVLNRQLRADGPASVDHKRVHRIMQAHGRLLARHGPERPDLPPTAGSSSCAPTCARQRAWTAGASPARCSDGVEFTCWNGDGVRGAFLIDAHDREVIGRSRRGQRRHRRLGYPRHDARHRAPQPVEMLGGNGSPRAARDTRILARRLGLKPCVTPVKSPQGTGIPEAFVRTRKRDHAQATPLPSAEVVPGLLPSWFMDHNTHHPHCGPKMRSPRQCAAVPTATA